MGFLNSLMKALTKRPINVAPPVIVNPQAPSAPQNAVKLPELFPEFHPDNHIPNRPSAHFSWEETFVSDTARVRKIQNDWRVTEAHRIKEFRDRITFNCKMMEVVREILGQSISVNSMYRSWELNKAIGGSATSVHPEGLAIDFTPTGNLADHCDKIVAGLEARGIGFDQIIQEGGWIHIGWANTWDAKNAKPGVQRKQKMRMVGGQYYMGFRP